MTRRSWLQRAFAGAAFVAGANFATLVVRAKPVSWHDRPVDYFQIRVGPEIVKGKLMAIYQDVLSGGPHVPWNTIGVSILKT